MLISERTVKQYLYIFTNIHKQYYYNEIYIYNIQWDEKQTIKRV